MRRVLLAATTALLLLSVSGGAVAIAAPADGKCTGNASNDPDCHVTGDPAGPLDPGDPCTKDDPTCQPPRPLPGPKFDKEREKSQTDSFVPPRSLSTSV
jgi:hypothetical protein